MKIFIYTNELDKASSQQDMAYGDFEDLPRKTASDKALRDKAFNIKYKNVKAKIPKHDGYQRGLTSMVYKFFDEKSTSNGTIKNKNTSSEELAEELHKPITSKFEKRQVYSSFQDNIWGADFADMQLISKFTKRIRFLLCVTDIFITYTWVIPLKDEKETTITNAFQNVIDKLKRKPNKIWVDKGREFYNRLLKIRKK